MTITKPEGDPGSPGPQIFQVGGNMSHACRMVVVAMEPLQSILIFDFISDNSAKKLLKSVHAFQFLTCLQGKSEQAQLLHHLNPSSAYNYTHSTHAVN